MELTSSTVVTAIILTKNEEPNLKRVLDRLTWLQRVVILDSFSTDATLDIANSYPNVEVFQRKFDTHGNQWNYGLSLLKSKWALTLDADYVLTPEFIEETKSIVANPQDIAYETTFKFLVFGRKLFADNTTPRPVLFDIDKCMYYDDGHTQRLKINGTTGRYKSYILHDDRKSLSRWLSNQDGYAIKESKKLVNEPASEMPLSGKIRKTKVLAPFLVFFHCLFVKRLIFNGWEGWHYTLQRTMVEILLAIRLIEDEKLAEKPGPAPTLTIVKDDLKSNLVK
ncbi:glycosyltransferase family 2 protein [Mucilaginibacter sp. SMC90]|uniref:glycosyltransferase family 2 protein n=1 Tax=Mucilaginibacter sp. SMC90 TaxID=2929803 RepID=UPI001FB30B21|nr:glycosyltransferase family 2 protein [Mucilaginibacter sp. SMC90]UOE51900.1 glycosyltransferase family 2 protein [Mucilaginibacter sp. SMC90]